MVFLCLCITPPPFFFKFRGLTLFLILGYNSLNSILCGWRAYSKFSLIGRIRTVSQLISYEAVLYLCLFFVILFLGSFDFKEFLFFPPSLFFIISFPCFYIWLPTLLAELNRTPYDFSEGESELVRGFNTEFGSVCFTLIFLGEYGIIVFFCALSSSIFFSSLRFLFCLIFFFSLVWIRSVLPRFRFDKLMLLAWKFLIPFLTFFYAVILTCLF